jgi:hypothetical protein
VGTLAKGSCAVTRKLPSSGDEEVGSCEAEEEEEEEEEVVVGPVDAPVEGSGRGAAA